MYTTWDVTYGSGVASSSSLWHKPGGEKECQLSLIRTSRFSGELGNKNRIINGTIMVMQWDIFLVSQWACNARSCWPFRGQVYFAQLYLPSILWIMSYQDWILVSHPIRTFAFNSKASIRLPCRQKGIQHSQFTVKWEIYFKVEALDRETDAVKPKLS